MHDSLKLKATQRVSTIESINKFWHIHTMEFCSCSHMDGSQKQYAEGKTQATKGYHGILSHDIPKEAKL